MIRFSRTRPAAAGAVVRFRMRGARVGENVISVLHSEPTAKHTEGDFVVAVIDGDTDGWTIVVGTFVVGP